MGSHRARRYLSAIDVQRGMRTRCKLGPLRCTCIRGALGYLYADALSSALVHRLPSVAYPALTLTVCGGTCQSLLPSQWCGASPCRSDKSTFTYKPRRMDAPCGIVLIPPIWRSCRRSRLPRFLPPLPFCSSPSPSLACMSETGGVPNTPILLDRPLCPF